MPFGYFFAKRQTKPVTFVLVFGMQSFKGIKDPLGMNNIQSDTIVLNFNLDQINTVITYNSK
jgi:hypothetical protein